MSFWFNQSYYLLFFFFFNNSTALQQKARNIIINSRPPRCDEVPPNYKTVQYCQTVQDTIEKTSKILSEIVSWRQPGKK